MTLLKLVLRLLLESCKGMSPFLLLQSIKIVEVYNIIIMNQGHTLRLRMTHESTFYCTALFSEDYTYKSMIPEKRLTFGPSISSACIYILALNDEILESNENFTLVLSSSLADLSAISFSVQEATVEILEDSVDGMESMLLPSLCLCSYIAITTFL